MLKCDGKRDTKSVIISFIIIMQTKPGAVILMMMLAAQMAIACTVPVFRYALEQWPPDNYVIEAYVGEHVSEEGAKALALLDKCGPDKETAVNVAVKKIEVKEAGGEPQIKVYMPRAKTPFWEAELTVKNVQRLIDSPARRKVVEKIIDGDSAVWIVVGGGDEETDAKVSADLETYLEQVKGHLSLPDGENTTLVAEDTEDEAVVRISFDVVRIRRTDPEEQCLVEMLLNSRRGLESIKDPMAFPVFGRGRVINPLIGRGINVQMVAQSCRYVVDSCSCDVKSENPGCDLLMAVNWEDGIQGRAVKQPEFHLTGISDFEKNDRPVSDQTDALLNRKDTDKASPCCTFEKSPDKAAGSETAGRASAFQIKHVIISLIVAGIAALGFVFVKTSKR